MSNFRKYRICAYRIFNNKTLYTTRAEKFNFEEINQQSEKKWRTIFDSERSEEIVIS